MSKNIILKMFFFHEEIVNNVKISGLRHQNKSEHFLPNSKIDFRRSIIHSRLINMSLISHNRSICSLLMFILIFCKTYSSSTVKSKNKEKKSQNSISKMFSVLELSMFSISDFNPTNNHSASSKRIIFYFAIMAIFGGIRKYSVQRNNKWAYQHKHRGLASNRNLKREAD